MAGNQRQGRLAARAARSLAAGLGCDLEVLTPDSVGSRPVLIGLEQVPVGEYHGTLEQALRQVGPADLVVLPAGLSGRTLAGPAAALVVRTDRPTVVVAAAPGDAMRAGPSSRVLAGRA